MPEPTTESEPMSTPEIKRLFGDPVPFALKELACNVAEVYAETTAAREKLQRKINRLNTVVDTYTQTIWDKKKLKRRNVGGHHYPGITSAGYEHGSKCDYCDCFMGASTSSAPDGVDQFGECPGNPDLRPEYEALEQRVAELELQLADMKAAEIGLSVKSNESKSYPDVVTEEWCLANGAEAEDDGGDTIYVWPHRELDSDGKARLHWVVFINDLGELWLEVSFDGCGSVMISAKPTRRQVRDLIRALKGGE